MPDYPYTAQDWGRLGDVIRTELNRRGWTQQDLAERASVSLMTVSTLINGHQRGRIPRSLPAIERALDWPAGAARVLLEGGVLAWEAFVNRHGGNQGGLLTGRAAIDAFVTGSSHPTRPLGVRKVADLVRKIEALRDAIEGLPLSAADRQRFLADLAAYEDSLTETLDRQAAERDAG